jgi:tetratricopeptide (TPR) repeat protein
MNSTDELFDRYLLGRMSEQEKAAFESRLDRDARLREEWELHQSLAKALQLRGERVKLAELARKIQQKKQRRHLIWGATSLLLLVMLYAGWRRLNPRESERPSIQPAPLFADTTSVTTPLPKETAANTPSPPIRPDARTGSQKAMLRYFGQDYPKSQRMGAAESPADSLFALAREAFDLENWQEAVRLYEAIPQLEWYSDHYDRLGAAYLRSGQADKAVTVFRRLAERPRTDLREKAEWYLLLALLANQDREGFEARIAPVLKDKKGRNYERCVALKRAVQ